MPLPWFVGFSSLHPALAYGLIVALACAEGPVLSLVLGVLVRLGAFDLLPAYAALVAGDLVGDVFWYWVGYAFGPRFIARFGRYFGVTEAGVQTMSRLFHRYKVRILFLSKVSNGLGLSLVTLMSAAMVRIPFRIYLAVNLAGQLVWTGFLLGIGYFLSSLYVEIDNVFWRISVLAAAAAILIAGVRLQRYLRRRAEGAEP